MTSDAQSPDELQLTLIDIAASRAAGPTTRRRGLRVQEVSQWASQVARRLARRARLQGTADSLLLTQTVKLSEEVGELCAEVLGAARLQRESKGDRYSAETLGAELADVAICVAIIADLVGVNLDEALMQKMALIDERMTDELRHSAG